LKKLWKKYEPVFNAKYFIHIVLSMFMLINMLVLFFVIKPWKDVGENSWRCGFEAGRIARNILSGYGYSSPFIYFKGDKPIKPPPTITKWGKNAYKDIFINSARLRNIT